MKSRMSLLCLALVASLSGCASGSEGSPAPVASSPPAVFAACDRTSYDLTRESAAIEAVRRRAPALSDDLAAFSVSLLPPDVFDLAGLTPVVGRTPNGGAAYAEGDTVLLLEDADVAPAEFADNIMQVLAMYVALPGGAEAAAPFGSTVAADTYIKLVGDRPELGRGPHTRNRSTLLHVTDRLRGKGLFTRESVRVDGLAGVPEFLDELGRYFGAEYYHADGSSAGTWTTRYPLPAARGAELLAGIEGCLAR